MKLIIFRELERYNYSDLNEKIGISHEKLDTLVKTLIENSVIRSNQSQISIYKEGGQLNKSIKIKYWFNYVGLIIIENILISVTPKYVNTQCSENEAIELLRVLTDVFRLYSKESINKSEAKMLGEVYSELDFSMISAIDFFINDYNEYGRYSSTYEDYELNGIGEIHWGKTVERNDLLISNKSPIHYGMITYNSEIDDSNFITKVHEFILNMCSSIAEQSGLNKLLDYPFIHYDIEEDSLGGDEFIINRIEQQLSIEFSDRKIRLLKAMKNFISKMNREKSDETIAFFGTNSFNLVWQKICEYVYGHDKRLQKYINRPIWRNNFNICNDKETLEPDIMTVLNLTQNKLVILDPKYYSMDFIDDKFEGNPGIGDVIKQYMYEVAMGRYMDKNNISNCTNAFLFPTESNNIEYWGEVALDFWDAEKTIKVVKLPVYEMLKRYKSRSPFDLSEWATFIDGIENISNSVLSTKKITL